VEELTPRETEVLQLLADGLTNKAIAQRLGISDHTVKFHVNAVLGKLGAQSRTEAVVRATRLGLLHL
jgi:DNA-binding NarL/FixJ family response regulator